jgi:hypothetical protein
MGLFSKKIKYDDNVVGGPEGSHSVTSNAGTADVEGIPIGIFGGYQPPASLAPTVPGASSYQVDPSPVTFARYNMSRGIHDYQLLNGLQGRTGQGFIMGYQNEGYLSEVQPTIPGQMRLIGAGGSPANYAPKTNFSPQTWQNAQTQAQNNSTQTAGGPGQFYGTLQGNYMSASGG